MSAAALHPLHPEARALTGRDLAWLSLCLVAVLAPHAVRTAWWLPVFSLALLAWRARLAITQGPLPRWWLLAGVAVLGMIGVGIEYRTLFGRSAGIALLMIFAGLKLLEMRTHRDATVAVFLCYFLILTNFLFTQSIPNALAMFVALVVITAALVSFSAPQRSVKLHLRTAGLLLAQAIPVAALLFVLFPRVQGPLWGMPQDAYSGVTGLSDTMAPGNLSQLSQSDATAFRVLFAGAAPLPRQLYWRGPVLWDFDGRTWSAGVPRLRGPRAVSGGEAKFEYTVVLEPHNRNWLFALETAASVPDNAWVAGDEQLLSLRPVRNRMRYEMVSVVGGRHEGVESGPSLARALRLPAGYNPRTLALAAQWKREAQSDRQLVARAIAYFREQGFVYTLLPPLLGRDSVDEFVFDTRRGFCEHFSSAFVVLMRAAGVPARVVTGYQGGDFNPSDGYFTVRQAEAHAWAEVHIEGEGWVRLDPTAASAPGRLDDGLSRAVSAGDPVPFMLRAEAEWLRGMRYRIEALTNQWNLWVLGYNTERQREFLTRLGMSEANWRELASAMLLALAAAVLVLLAWSLKRIVRPDPVQQAWLKFCAKLAAVGLTRAAHEGPRDFAARAAADRPELAPAIRAIGESYLALRYGAARQSADARQAIEALRRAVREFRVA